MNAVHMHSEVSARCPPETPIPSVQWLRWQFWPRRLNSHVARYHTGELKVKHMVQSRQMRQQHIDSHYASATFRYLREFAVRFLEQSSFVSMDDKHVK